MLILLISFLYSVSGFKVNKKVAIQTNQHACNSNSKFCKCTIILGSILKTSFIFKNLSLYSFLSAVNAMACQKIKVNKIISHLVKLVKSQSLSASLT